MERHEPERHYILAATHAEARAWDQLHGNGIDYLYILPDHAHQLRGIHGGTFHVVGSLASTWALFELLRVIEPDGVEVHV